MTQIKTPESYISGDWQAGYAAGVLAERERVGDIVLKVYEQAPGITTVEFIRDEILKLINEEAK
jgi:hypothetical protein